MNYTDIFYSILHETNFFNAFFYEQYILDLDIQMAYNITTQKQYVLSYFLTENKIILDFLSLPPIHITTQYILITPKNFPQYRLLLKANPSLTHSENTLESLLSVSHIPIHQYTNLTKFLHTPVTSSYILFLDFLTNQNLETPEIKKHIFQILVNVFQKEICYFQQFDYHQYYLLLKNVTDIQIFNYCKTLKQCFEDASMGYLSPRFLLVECNNFYHFDTLLYKIKTYFQSSMYDSSLFLIKEKMDNL